MKSNHVVIYQAMTGLFIRKYFHSYDEALKFYNREEMHVCKAFYSNRRFQHKFMITKSGKCWSLQPSLATG